MYHIHPRPFHHGESLQKSHAHTHTYITDGKWKMVYWMCGLMDELLDNISDTHTHTHTYVYIYTHICMYTHKPKHTHIKTNITKLCWEWCIVLHISIQPRATITINQAGFDVQALILSDSPSTLSHNNLDDCHSRRLIEHGNVFVCLCPFVYYSLCTICFSLCLRVHLLARFCESVCTLSGDSSSFVVPLPDCTVRLEFGDIKGSRQNLVAGRLFSSQLIIVLLNCFVTERVMCVFFIHWNQHI